MISHPTIMTLLGLEVGKGEIIHSGLELSCTETVLWCYTIDLII